MIKLRFVNPPESYSQGVRISTGKGYMILANNADQLINLIVLKYAPVYSLILNKYPNVHQR